MRFKSCLYNAGLPKHCWQPLKESNRQYCSFFRIYSLQLDFLLLAWKMKENTFLLSRPPTWQPLLKALVGNVYSMPPIKDITRLFQLNLWKCIFAFYTLTEGFWEILFWKALVWSHRHWLIWTWTPHLCTISTVISGNQSSEVTAGCNAFWWFSILWLHSLQYGMHATFWSDLFFCNFNL